MKQTKMQHSKERKRSKSPLEHRPVFAQWNPVKLQEMKKKFVSIVIHMNMLSKSSVRLLEFVLNFSDPMCSFG
jgi:hypothetical protein